MNHTVQIPSPLTAGDTIAIIGPAGQITDRRRFDDGVTILTEMGFSPRFPRELWPGSGYLADSDANRAKELHNAFADPEVKGIIAVRGGYGCLRLLPHLDFDVIRHNPKILVGFSDITALLDQVVFHAGLLCLHGPVVTSLPDCSPDAISRLHACLTGSWHRSIRPKTLEVLRKNTTNQVSGRIRGGNLSTLITLLSTPFDSDWRTTILVLEDIGEPLYRLDRMLTQLALTGKLRQVAGIILGDFTLDQAQEPLAKRRHTEYVWTRVLELTKGEDIPVWGNFPTGHCQDNITLPFGAFSTMDCARGELRFG
jgi:muramoyltetrapeptide carboxypeptidase